MEKLSFQIFFSRYLSKAFCYVMKFLGRENIFYHFFALKDLKPTVRRDCFSSLAWAGAG